MERIQLRRDVSTKWAEINPILMEGEVGFEIDTKLRKIGDGVTAWNSLDYLAAENITQELGSNENAVLSQKTVTNVIDINISGYTSDSNDYTLETAIEILKNGNINVSVGNSIRFITQSGKLESYTYGGGGIQNVSSWYRNLVETVEEINELPPLEEGGIYTQTGNDDDSLIGTRVRSGRISSPLIKSIKCLPNSNIECRIFSVTDNNTVLWYDDYSTEKSGREIAQEFRLSFRKKDSSNITVADVTPNVEIIYCTSKYNDKDTQAKIDQELQTGIDNSLKETKISKTDLNITSYITDKNNSIIGNIDKQGGSNFVSGGFVGEKNYTLPNESNIIKVLTSENNVVIGYIDNKGKVYISDLEAKGLKQEGIQKALAIAGFVASGVDNHKIVSDKIYNLITLNPGTFQQEGVSIPTVPTIVIHDDDTLDNQIPTSYVRGATESTRPTTTAQGGYASILYPLLKSLNVRFKDKINATDNKIICGLAAEGQRTGLTKLYGQNDEFTGKLNSNGEIVKKLAERAGWEVMCHSMTARYISQNYLVNGLTSDFANEVLQNGVWRGDLYWGTTTCYDTVTKKNYQIKQDKSGWTELPKAYIKPYCAVSRQSNSQLVINPTYSVKYQVETWFDRAKIAGLPYLEKVGVNWGDSHSIWHMRESLKYADVFFARYDLNTIPLDTNIHRFFYNPSASRNGVVDNYGYYNVYTELEYKRMTDKIDECIEKNALLVLSSHVNAPENSNFYFSYYDYPTERTGDRLNYRDDNYNPQWTVPLLYDELMSIDENNYWEIPPARLGISNWGEWYPCPGTTMALLYDSLIYAINKGVRFATSKECIEDFGNLVNIGLRYDQSDLWAADARLGDIPEENKSYCIIGADGSIDYKS